MDNESTGVIILVVIVVLGIALIYGIARGLGKQIKK